MSEPAVTGRQSELLQLVVFQESSQFLCSKHLVGRTPNSIESIQRVSRVLGGEHCGYAL